MKVSKKRSSPISIALYIAFALISLVLAYKAVISSTYVNPHAGGCPWGQHPKTEMERICDKPQPRVGLQEAGNNEPEANICHSVSVTRCVNDAPIKKSKGKKTLREDN